MNQQVKPVGSQDDWSPSQREGGNRRWPVILVCTLIVGLVATFIVQNFDRVEIRVLAWEFDLPLSLALLLSGVTGFLVGLLVMRIRR